MIAKRHSTTTGLIVLVLLLATGQASAQNKLESPPGNPPGTPPGISASKPAEMPATSTAPADRAAEIEAEIASLKQRIEVLQKELSRLQPRVGSPSASAPSAKEDGSRVYGSAMEMLRDLPVAARPSPKDGWDSFTLPAAKDWLDKNVTGNRFESMVTLKSIEIRRKNQYEGPAGSPPWRVTLSTKSEQFKFGSATLDQIVTGASGMARFHIDGDEAFAKSAEKLVVGNKLRLTGKIADINVSMNPGRIKGGFEIILTEYEFLAEVLRQRKP